MSPAQLLENFDRISEAPDAIPRFRRFILDLAVRGKLVEQAPNDEPASELMERINAEKLRHAVERESKKEKSLPAINENEKPFDLPVGWVWGRLGDLTTFGKTEKLTAIPDSAWVLDLEDIEKDTSRLIQKLRFSDRPAKSDKNRFYSQDVLYGKLRPYLNKVIVADEDGVCTTEILPIRAYGGLIYSRFLMYALKRPDFLAYVNAKSYGMKMPRLGTEDGRLALLPIPPLAEQHRIVAKVDELMVLCDQLEEARAEREQTRDQLVAASLQRLNQPAADEASFQEDARFTFNHLTRITTRPAHIKQLRQTILNLAVRGRLVEQDLSIDKVDSRFIIEKHGVGLPLNWRLLNFGRFCDIEGGNQPPKSQFVDEERVGYVRLFQIRDLGDSPVPTYIPLESTNRFCKRGEILIGRYGASVGKIFWAQDGAYNVALAKFIYPENAFIAPFAFLVLKSNFFQSTLSDSTRSAQAGFNKSDLASIDFPLPPLAEQRRIVARVDELMALCDELEAQLTSTESKNRRFLEAVLQETLEVGA